MGRSHLWAFLVSVAAIAVMAPAELPAQDAFGGPARAQTENPDDMVVGSQSPGALVAGTEDLSSLEGTTHSLPNGVPTLSPLELVAPSESPGALVGETSSLSDLPEAREADAAAERQVEEQVRAAQPGFRLATSSGEAEAQLSGAKSRLEQANAAVGKMLQRDYPRGEARARIYAEQRAARQAVASASATVERFRGPGSNTASSPTPDPW